MSDEENKPRVHTENLYHESLANTVGSARELHKSLDEVLDDVRKQWRVAISSWSFQENWEVVYRTSVSQKVLRRTPLSLREFTAKVFAFLSQGQVLCFLAQ